jgi:hypothetical protein
MAIENEPTEHRIKVARETLLQAERVFDTAADDHVALDAVPLLIDACRALVATVAEQKRQIERLEIAFATGERASGERTRREAGELPAENSGDPLIV